LAQANSSDYLQLAQAKVLEGHESWGPIAVASGRLIVRDTEHMICLDISEQ
jgi:outer membrane protein assembly factor BamB